MVAVKSRSKWFACQPAGFRRAWSASVAAAARRAKRRLNLHLLSARHLTHALADLIILTVTHLSAFLVLLVLVLTFNAYACVLPLQPESTMDCSSATEQPVRQTCDAFLEFGPQSHSSISHEVPILKLVNFEAPPQPPTPVFLFFRFEHPAHGADTPIHLSISTTVLRI